LALVASHIPRTEQEEDASPDPFSCRVRRQHEQQQKDDDHENAEGPELTAEVGRCTLLDGSGDLLHLGSANAGREHTCSQDEGDEQRDDGHDAHCNDDRAVASTQYQVVHTAPDPVRQAQVATSADGRGPPAQVDNMKTPGVGPA